MKKWRKWVDIIHVSLIDDDTQWGKEPKIEEVEKAFKTEKSKAVGYNQLTGEMFGYQRATNTYWNI